MRLTDADRKLATATGLDEEVLLALRRHTRRKIERFHASTEDGTAPGPGVSIAVADGDEAERLMNALDPDLRGSGCRTFWSERVHPNGLKQTDELAVVKTDDAYTPIRLRRTDGANYDISTDDIVARVREWETISTFRIVGAAGSWVALQFETLPEKLCTFAEDVYLFCPDTVTQGVGLLRERDDPGRFAAARALCPEISARVRTRSDATLAQIEATDPEAARQFRDLLRAASALSHPDEADGVRLLAEELRRRKFLHLWWD